MMDAGEREPGAPKESAGPTGTQGETANQPSNQPSTVPHRSARQEPTILTLQDLLDLPGQILPEQTRYHLKNAGRETLLALYSLWRNINSSSQASSGGKVRKKIDVE